VNDVRSPTPLAVDGGASVFARVLTARGVDRVIGLRGAHIVPICPLR
jgi:hypothetical protein